MPVVRSASRESRERAPLASSAVAAARALGVLYRGMTGVALALHSCRPSCVASCAAPDMLKIYSLCINAPEGCQRGTHTNWTAYSLPTYTYLPTRYLRKYTHTITSAEFAPPQARAAALRPASRQAILGERLLPHRAARPNHCSVTSPLDSLKGAPPGLHGYIAASKVMPSHKTQRLLGPVLAHYMRGVMVQLA